MAKGDVMRNWVLGGAIATVFLCSSGAMAIAEQSFPILAQATEERQAEADRLLVLGVQQFQTSQFREALQSWEKALEIYREIGNRSGEGASLGNLGIVYQSLGEYNKAIDYHEQSLVIAREIGNRSGEGKSLSSLGNVYRLLGEYNRAIDYQEQSLVIAREIGNRSGEGASLISLGIVYQLLGEYNRAIDYYEQSLVIAREIGDRSGEGNSLIGLGNAYKSFGEYNRAIDYHEQSLVIAREIGDRSGEGNSLGNLGIVYQLLGEYNRAIDYHEQSLVIAREIGNRSGEGNSLHNLGIVYELLGEYNKAIDYYEQSWFIAREIGNRSGEGNSLIGLGNVYRLLGEYNRAIDYQEQSLIIAREIGDRSGEGNSLGNLGIVYQLSGEYNRAIDYHEQSLVILREIGNRSGEGASLNNLGNVYQSLGEYNRAIDYQEQSLAIKREISDRSGEGKSLGNLGNVYQLLGEYNRAIDHYEQSLVILREIGDRSGEGIALENLALTKHKQGNSEEALKDVETSIEIAESIRSEVDNPDLRQSFFATVSNRYAIYINILMQLHRENPDRGYDKQAFQASEKNRARTLTEILTEARFDIRQNVGRQLLQEERRLIQALSEIEQRRLELTSGSYANKDLESLVRDRDALLKQLSDLETRIRRENPAYADLKYPQPLTLEEIQSQVLDEDTLLLEYALGSERSYLFAVGKNEFAVYELPPRQEIESAAEKYEIALQAEDRNPLAEGKAIAQMLLSPIADKFKGQRLAIVADGKLHRLPFGALPWGASGAGGASGASGAGASIAPLLARHEIVHLSSASSLAIQRQQTENRSPAAKKLAVFADPVFSRRDPRLSGEVATTPENALLSLFRDGCQSFDRLPYTRTEAENILSLVPDDQKFLAMGFDADRTAATHEELAQYEILHLSTHGCIQDNPQLSGLALSLYDEEGQQQDGFLRLQDIYNLQLNADLVVLSACQTGIGEEVSGEGVVGLTRGFMYAGARRVTVSLWNVSDRATADLMSEYYKKMLSEEKSPAAALREAQLQMWKAGEYPYKWAAFVMQGDWQ